LNTVKPNENIHNATVLKIWQWLSAMIPLISSRDYKDAHVKYINKIIKFGSNPHFGPQKISPDEAEKIPSNSEHYDNLSYEYRGLAKIKSMLEERIPIAFLTWHHGAFHHVTYAIARTLPQVAIFTFPTYQYGKVFSYSMDKNQALSLIKMDRFLNEGRPILYHIDGLPLGKCITLKILGVETRLSTAPIKIIRGVKDVRIIPVTSYYVEKGEVDQVNTTFHDPLPSQNMLKQMTDREVLTSLIDHFEKDLCENAPEQVSMTLFVSREQFAKEVSLKRINERKEMI